MITFHIISAENYYIWYTIVNTNLDCANNFNKRWKWVHVYLEPGTLQYQSFTQIYSYNPINITCIHTFISIHIHWTN